MVVNNSIELKFLFSTYVIALEIIYCYLFYIRTEFFHIKHICINFGKHKEKKRKYKICSDAMFLHLINITNDTIYTTPAFLVLIRLVTMK